MRPARAVFVLVLSLTSLPVFAQVYRAPETDEPAKKSAAATNVQAPGDGMTVAIDPATGALRQPTKAEAEALTGARDAAPRRALRIVKTSSGMQMVELDDSFLEYLTVRKDADGQLHAACVHANQVPSILRLPVPAVQKLEEK